MIKRFLLLLIILTFVQITFAQSFKVVAYLPDYRWSNINSIDYTKTTHVIAAFGNPDSSGTISFIQNIDQLVSAAHAGGAKAMIALGGGNDYSWGNDHHTYEYLFTNANRTAFVIKVMDYVRLHQLDGIDLDLEGFALQLSNYNIFSQELADSLHLSGLEISGAYVSGSWATYVTDATLQKLDFITTQSYGGVGDWNWNAPSDQSPLSLLQSDVIFWKTRSLPASKILGGLPFYAVEFPPAIQPFYWPYHPTLCSVYNGTQFSSQHPLKNDLVYATNGDPVYLNSLKTFRKKINYAVANAGGIMIWEIGSDCYDGSISILDSLNSYISKATLSVADPLSFNSMNFYPNPANSFIKIDGEHPLINAYTISDVYGKEIKRSTLSGEIIDISGIDRGLYFIDFIEEGVDHNPVRLMIQR
jgi:chitinase